MLKNKFIFLNIIFLSFLIYSIKNFYNKSYNIDFFDKNEKNNNRIIAVIFAGRKKYLEILMIYLNYLNKIIKFMKFIFGNIQKKKEM